MTTSLVISYPDIPWRAARVRATYGAGDTEPAYDESYHFYNSVTGERSTYWINTTTSDQFKIQYYLTSGVTSSADHCIMGMTTNFPSNYNLSIESSTDDSSWTTEAASAGAFSGEPFVGPDDNDWIKTFTTANSRRYWRLRMVKQSGSNDNIYLSKLYLGTFFDWSKEPEDYSISRIPLSQAVYYGDAGTVNFKNYEDSVYSINITWLGVTDDKIRDFYNNIVKYKHLNPVFLYARSVGEVLDSQTLIHCRLLTCSTEQVGKKTDFNLVRCQFEQVLG